MTALKFVIPLFNERESLPSLVERLEQVAHRITAQHSCSVGLVFVDDGSSDGSFDWLEEHDFALRSVQLIKLSRNFGKEAALSAGIAVARDADAVILMDADLQHPPEMTLEFVRIWRDGKADSIYAYKAQRRQSEGWLKDLVMRGFYWHLNHQARFLIPRNAGDFRLLDRCMVEALLQLPESTRFMKGLYGWVGFRQVGLPFDPPPRAAGETSFRAVQLLALSLDALTSFTTTPLRIMAVTGFGIALLSLVYGAYIIFERLFLTPNAAFGIASVLVLVSFFGGVQMIFMGLLGEYVGKIVIEAKRRPSYLVATELHRGGLPGKDGCDD